MRPFSVDKMRRNMARNTPDAVWRTFDLMSDNYLREYEVWCANFQRSMEVKHGRKFIGVSIYRSELLYPENVRVQLLARLRR